MNPALSTLTEAILARPELGAVLGARWRRRGSTDDGDAGLSEEILDAANRLAHTLPAATQSDPQLAALGALFDEPEGDVLLAWCAASVWRADVRLAPVLIRWPWWLAIGWFKGRYSTPLRAPPSSARVRSWRCPAERSRALALKSSFGRLGRARSKCLHLDLGFGDRARPSTS
jgi:hypothetical protein